MKLIDPQYFQLRRIGNLQLNYWRCWEMMGIAYNASEPRSLKLWLN